MNRGLKQYTKQLTQTVGNAGSVNVNLNKDDANLIAELPLLTTLGDSPISIGLIYNHQNRNENGIFGKGIRLNYYSKVVCGIGEYILKNADGSEDIYSNDESFNEETGSKIVYNEETNSNSEYYELIDKYENSAMYDENSGDYPFGIYMKNGTHYSISMTSSQKYISNNKGDIIRFNTTNNYVTEIHYFHNNEELYMCNLTYNNGYLSNIAVKKVVCIDGVVDAYIEKSNVDLLFSESLIVVKDNLNDCKIEYTLQNGKVTSFTGYVCDLAGAYQATDTTSISYEQNKTTITVSNGKKTYVFFDSNGLPLYEMDDDANVIKTEYDKQTKCLLSQSSVIPTKNRLENLFPGIGIDYFNKNEVSIIPYSIRPTSMYYNALGNSAYKVTGTGSLSYSVDVEGLGTDNITLVLFGKQLTPYTDTSNVEVALEADSTCRKCFKKEVIDDNFDLVVLGMKALSTYKKVKVTINLKGNSSIILGGLQVLKKDFGSFYEYDANGNNLSKETGYGSIQSSYNESNMLTGVVGADSAICGFKYDDKGNLIDVSFPYWVMKNNTYDNNNNLTKSLLFNSNMTKIVENTKMYDSAGALIQEMDALGNTTNYTYDEFGKLIKVIDALSIVTEYKYDLYDNLIQIIYKKGRIEYNANYTYDDKNRLTLADFNDEKVYSFTYNNYGDIEAISLNNERLFTNIYDENRTLVKLIYGENGDGYRFEYNLDDRISKIYYVYPNGTESLRYQYEYDEYKCLRVVKDKNNKVLKQLTYDNDFNVVNANGDGFNIEYQYDNLGNVNLEKKEVVQKKMYQSYDTISRSKGCCPEALNSILFNKTEYISSIFRGTTFLSNKNYGVYAYNCLTGDQTKVGYEKDGIIPCIFANISKPICYNMGNSLNESSPGECIGFWFYGFSSNSERYLFSTKSGNGSGEDKSLVGVYIGKDRKLRLKLIDSNGNQYEPLITDNTYKLDEWNFFSLNWVNRNIEQGINYICEYQLTLNEKMKVFTSSDSKFDVHIANPAIFHIGYNVAENSISKPLNAHITALMIGNRTNVTKEEMQEYYRLTKDYLIDNEYVSDEIRTVDFSATNLHTINQNMLNDFEIYPLQNSVTSLTGKKPISFSVRNKTSLDKDRTFNFNKDIKHYCYVADGNDLAYNFGLIGDGTIMLRAYFDGKNNQQCILESEDENGYNFKFYRNNNDELIMKYLLVEYNTRLKCLNDKWYTIAFSYRYTLSSDSYGNPELVFRVFVKADDAAANIYTKYLYGKDGFGLRKTEIGRCFEESEHMSYLGSFQTSYPLLGQIEMLAVRNAYCEESTLALLAEELKDYSKISEYDDFGMLKRIDIHKCGSSILSNTYEYKTRSDTKYISSQIKKETIKYGNSSVNRNYETDVEGRVTSVTDNIFGSHTYEYDLAGELIVEDNTNYTYDNNGNILTAGNTTFTYDSTIKDRLDTVNGEKIYYSFTDNFKPRLYKGIEYQFEGRRLVSLSEEMDIDEQKTVDYTYDDQGLIIKKVVGYWYSDDRDSYEEVTNYYYNGDRLITEITPYHRNDYLYDENGQVYGFIQDNNTKYFYVKDFMQNILGLVDINGRLVVKYSCDAYGNRVSDIYYDNDGNVTFSQGIYNPIRYKGYYFDYDVDMYYCKSRFYVPKWRRWLIYDSAQYLDIENVGCANLFAYCNNNPVMYSDGDGHFAISTLAWIIVGIAAVTTAATVTYGAITDTPVALDFSISGGMGAGMGLKVGVSLVIDFKNKSFGLYPHFGYYGGVKWNVLGFSYSTGLIQNYVNEGDYAGPFIDFGGGYLIGIDHCYDPRYPHSDTVKANSITFGNNKGIYYGHDYYWYMGSITYKDILKAIIGGAIFL